MRRVRDERPRGERRPRPRPGEWAAIVAIAAISAVGAVVVDAHPTANRGSDAVLLVALSVGVVAASSVARASAWVFASAVAAVLAPGGWMLASVVALLIGVAGSVVGDLPHRRVVGALVGCLVVQTLLRLDLARFGASAVAATAAVVALGGSAWSLTRRSTRVRIRIGAVLVIGTALVVTGAFALTVLRSRANLELGIARAEEGLAAARAGDVERAAQLLAEGSRAFDEASRGLSSWFARPASVLPIVGQHQQALELLAGAGAELSAAAAEAASIADVQTLVVRGGALDLQRVAGMTAPLAALDGALVSAGDVATQARSPWLLAPLSRRLDSFERSVDTASSEATTASQVVGLLPALLGGEGDRHYFVAFATPAESRELGGFTGAFGVLTAHDGRLTLTRAGGIQELNDLGRGRQLTDPELFPARFRALRLDEFWQNITGTPDFPTVAEAVRQMWSQSGGGDLDGVLYLDPYALASLLELTGPVTVGDWPEALTHENTADFLFSGQYESFDVIDERTDFLLTIARTVFDRLTSADLPGPSTMIDVLAPDVRQRRLLAHSFHADEQRLFEQLGLDGALPPVRGDFLMVTSSNLGRNKIDALLHRTIDYDVIVDPDQGTVAATMTLTLRNDAPASGRSDYVIGNQSGVPPGTNLTAVAVYTPLRLVEATTEGAAVDVGASEEYGRRVYTVLLAVPPGSERVVTIALAGPLDLRSGYRLDVVPQATVNADDLDVRVNTTGSWRVEGTGDLQTVLDTNVSLFVPLAPA